MISDLGNQYMSVSNQLVGINENGPLTDSLNRLTHIFLHLGIEIEEIEELLCRQDVPQLIRKAQMLSGWC